MEKIEIDLKGEYLRLANAYSVQKDAETKKENIRKDIDLLLDVLGHHTVTKGYSETSDVKYIIDDDIDRKIVTQKLLSKIKQL